GRAAPPPRRVAPGGAVSDRGVARRARLPVPHRPPAAGAARRPGAAGATRRAAGRRHVRGSLRGVGPRGARPPPGPPPGGGARPAAVCPSSGHDRRQLLAHAAARAEGSTRPRDHRALAGLQLRAGAAEAAVEALQAALQLRAEGAPPVEELWLALAYAQLG